MTSSSPFWSSQANKLFEAQFPEQVSPLDNEIFRVVFNFQGRGRPGGVWAPGNDRGWQGGGGGRPEHEVGNIETEL